MKCEVLFSHCREIEGVLTMFEPLFGIVEVPDDEQTQLFIDQEWLKPIEIEIGGK